MSCQSGLLGKAGLALLIVVPYLALAAPPDWAPAHGWRKQHDSAYPGYTGYAGRDWTSDYGVASGSCDRSRVGQALGATVGGIAGGAIGAEVAKGSPNRDVAIVVGAVVGAAIGAQVGRRMDKTDRSCMGHALELADTGRSVKWTNPNTRVTYQLTPLAAESDEHGCRSFRLIAHGESGLSEGRTVACTDGSGVWRPVTDDRYNRR